MKKLDPIKVQATKFKVIRLKLGITQRSLGIKLGVTQGAVSHWETGESYPSLEIAMKLSKLAGKKGIYFQPKYLRGNHG